MNSTKHTGSQAIKRNRLKDKDVRYESPKSFLTRCIDDKIIPKGLIFELEPTIDKHDQDLFLQFVAASSNHFLFQ